MPLNNVLSQLSDLEVLILTIIGEARGEPIESQIAVGCVIRNRIERGQNYKDICLAPKQFSCWNTDDPNREYLLELGQKMLDNEQLVDSHIRQCMWVAKGIESYDIIDITNGSKYYMTKQLFNSAARPKWALTPIHDPIQKGSQVFFNV